jgi:hypothetical protein
MTTPVTAAGRVERCTRYPVKSLQGLDVNRLEIGPTGVQGDRTYGIVAAEGGVVLSAKRTSALLDASATDDHLTLPDGTTIAVDAPEVDDVLSAWLGRPVVLVTPNGTGPVSYQMTFDPPNDGAEYFDIPTPDASFVDLAPIHLLTTATLRAAAEVRPDLDWDARRFRPNLVLDVEGGLFEEQRWVGRRIRVGAVVLHIDSPTVRCAMPLRAQPGGIERQPELYRALHDLNAEFPDHLGVYASVVEAGTVAVGDPVEVG